VIFVRLPKVILCLALWCLLSLSLPAQTSRLQSATTHYDDGKRLQTMEDWFGASEQYLEALRFNPAFGDAWFALAECSYALGEYSLAMTYLDEADKYTRDKSSILTLRAFTFIGLGKLKEAETLFNDVLKRYPNNVDARFGLAELDIFYGRISNAEQQYLDALKRQSTNRKALLSLALVSAELNKRDAVTRYIDQALRYHSGDAEVHYLASYIALTSGRLDEAEYEARQAVRFNANYDRAWELLALALYRLKRYDEAAAVCDYRIGKDRLLVSAWYLKALALENAGKTPEAIAVLAAAVETFPEDEVVRLELEALVLETLPLDDARRSRWSTFHATKAKNYRELFMSQQALYEYQNALRLDPFNIPVRSEYATLLLASGFPQRYLSQLQYIAEQGDAPVSVRDTIEGYESLLTNTLSKSWGIDQFYLDKHRWKIGLYYAKSNAQLIHEDAEQVFALTLAGLLEAPMEIEVSTSATPLADYAGAYRTARTANLDYFILLSYEENERELSLSGTVYSGRTGTETGKIRVYRTGNDRAAAALRRFTQVFTDLLPVRGKIIARNGNETLIDLGKAEGVAKDAEFTVIKAGKLVTRDTGPGLTYADTDVLGKITVSGVDEAVSAGTLSRSGFFDMVNVGDEVINTANTTVPGEVAPVVITDVQGVSDTAGRMQRLLGLLREIR
jgi:tetratricopeptide (TPR) repeat protein